jgi:hypothetical protein
MIPEITELVKVLKDPVLILSALVICGLFYLLIQREKQCSKCVGSVDGCGVTLTRLATLIEMLLYKGGKGI